VLGRQKTHFENAKPKFCFGKKKKAWFAQIFTFTNHVLGMKLKTSFSKRVFCEKHGKKISS
jgi:hypothetical protein